MMRRRDRDAPAPPSGDAVDAVQRLLTRAREAGASDLHVEPDEDGVRAVIRRDGVLEPLERLPAEIAPRIVGRFKALAELLAYRTDVPQEGRIEAARSGIGLEVRVATFPTIFGERVAVRLDTPATGTGLTDLGLPEHALTGLERALAEPEGVILLTGPAGSGKTTTMYSCLRALTDGGPRRTVVTVEDPVERRIRGVTQTQIDVGAGLTFARALRSLLRQDPDVLMVGEIRDQETAAIALEAGLTGHLVLSTVHAGTAPQVFARLLEMGLEPFVLTTTIRGVLGQRLVRATCSDCGASGGDCSRCDGRGSAGRRLVAEWLEPGEAMRAAVRAKADGIGLAAAAAEQGFRGLREHAERLVADGITTSAEIGRVLGTPR